MKSRATKGKPHLIGKGGVGLVMYQLARRGIEFVETTGGSAAGDLWVCPGPNNIIQAEVKTTTQSAWHLRQSQIISSSMFFLVSLHDAKVWILTSAEVQSALIGVPQLMDGVIVLPRSRLPDSALNGWDKVLAPPKQKAARARQPPVSALDFIGDARVVRRTLATGEVRDYRYCRETGRRVIP